MNVSGLLGISKHLQRLSETGDPLEMLVKIIDFEAFWPLLARGARLFRRIEGWPSAP